MSFSPKLYVALHANVQSYIISQRVLSDPIMISPYHLFKCREEEKGPSD